MTNFFNSLLDSLKIKHANHQSKTIGVSTILGLIVALLLFLFFEYTALLPLNLRNPSFILMIVVLLVVFNCIRSILSLVFDNVSKISVLLILDTRKPIVTKSVILNCNFLLYVLNLTNNVKK